MTPCAFPVHRVVTRGYKTYLLTLFTSSGTVSTSSFTLPAVRMMKEMVAMYRGPTLDQRHEVIVSRGYLSTLFWVVIQVFLLLDVQYPASRDFPLTQLRILLTSGILYAFHLSISPMGYEAKIMTSEVSHGVRTRSEGDEATC